MSESWEVVSANCHSAEQQQSQEQRKEFARALRKLLDCSDSFMHAHICMRTHFHARTQMHVHA